MIQERMTQETSMEGQKLVIRRQFAAPVEKVYQAWTDPARLARWLSPNVRWNAPVVDIEPVPGGRYDVRMRHSDGDEFHTVGRYVEVVPNERLSFTWTWLGSPFGMEETFVTVEFRPVSAGTELTLTHDRQTDPKALEGTSGGWTGCLDMLESYLNGTPLLGGSLASTV